MLIVRIFCHWSAPFKIKSFPPGNQYARSIVIKDPCIMTLTKLCIPTLISSQVTLLKI